MMFASARRAFLVLVGMFLVCAVTAHAEQTCNILCPCTLSGDGLCTDVSTACAITCEHSCAATCSGATAKCLCSHDKRDVQHHTLSAVEFYEYKLLVNNTNNALDGKLDAALLAPIESVQSVTGEYSSGRAVRSALLLHLIALV